MDNRRKHERFDSTEFLSYKPRLFSAKIDTVTKNISLKGACFFSVKKLEIGKIILLKLNYGGKAGSKKVKARIIHSDPVKDKLGSGYFNGVEFVDKSRPS